MKMSNVLGAFTLAAACGAALHAGQGQGRGTSTGAGTVTLAGVVRDFRAANTRGGHPDFGGSQPAQGRGVYAGIAADTLNADGDPVFASTGHKVTTQAKDAAARPRICDKAYIAGREGDVASVVVAEEGHAVASDSSFADWFRDNPLVNMSAPFEIPMTEVNGTLKFDGDLRTQFANLAGFGGNKVFGYTFEVESQIQVSGQEQLLTFGADDAVWVYIDGKLVIDLGGNHDYTEQTVDVSRIEGLVPGGTYTLKVFYAERDKSGSRFRMETTGALMRVVAPPTTIQWD